MNVDLSSVPEVPASELAFRWVEGYYSGILTGFAHWKGGLCYFEICDEAAEKWKYTLHSLTAEEAGEAIRDYEEWKARWGDHNDLLPDGSYAGGTCRATLQDLAAAGDAIAAGERPTPIPHRLKPIVGWFKTPESW